MSSWSVGTMRPYEYLSLRYAAFFLSLTQAHTHSLTLSLSQAGLNLNAQENKKRECRR